MRGEPIVFRSSAVKSADGRMVISGDLELAGTTRPAAFELDAAADDRVSGTLTVTQSEWGIKPYRGLMGALKVRDAVEVVLDVRLPLGTLAGRAEARSRPAVVAPSPSVT